jgi:glycosyltransferase involved in cell wall biosynthesis
MPPFPTILEGLKPRKKVAVLCIFPLHFLESFGARFNPVGHYATWLPQIAESWQSETEFEIHWLTGSDLVREPATSREMNQTFHVYPIASKGRATSLYSRDCREIQKILGQIQPDLVHAWGTEDVCGFAGVRSGYPCLLSMQGIHTNLIRYGLHHLRVYFQAALEAYCLARAGWVTVESEWGRKKIQPFRMGRPIEILEYGVHPLFFDACWRPTAQTPTFLFVGTICPQKGIEDCLAAFRDPRLAHARLEVFGSGNPRYLSALRQGSPPNVEWRGRQPPEKVALALEKASGLILPTRADTSPNVVKEARVVGLPVITSPQGGQTTYLKDGEDGFLVPCHAISELTSAIAQLSRNPEKVRAMGEAGKSRYREQLRAKVTAQAFLSLYRKIFSELEGG